MITRKAILATLAYHDIFDFPLKLEEVDKYLIGKRLSRKSLEIELQKLLSERKVGCSDEYFYLKNRKNIATARKNRKLYSKKRLEKAMTFASLLKLIPQIKLLAISGALAMENSQRKDDIDFVIITERNRIWTTRLLANILLMPVKRNPRSEIKNDKVCLNLFLDESELKIKNQNLYTAHEIVQMKLLWDRGKTYQKFIAKNSWIKKYLPNWRLPIEKQPNAHARQSKNQFANRLPLSGLWNLLETLSKSFQIKYMRSKITTEKIGDHQLFFHPRQTQTEVLEEYENRLKRFS